METSRSDSVGDDEEATGLFSKRELEILRTVSRSKVWRLMRDALCLERERLFNLEPATSNELWAQRGAIKQVNRLLHQGPHLAVYYDRHVRDQEAKGEQPVASVAARVGEAPDLGDV